MPPTTVNMSYVSEFLGSADRRFVTSSDDGDVHNATKKKSGSVITNGGTVPVIHIT